MKANYLHILLYKHFYLRHITAEIDNRMLPENLFEPSANNQNVRYN